MAVLVRARREDPHHQHPQQARPQLQDPDRPLDGRPERARADRSRGTAIAIPEFANPVLDVGRLYPRESRTGKYARRTARLGTVGDKHRLGRSVRSRSGAPVALRDDRWLRPSRDIRRSAQEAPRMVGDAAQIPMFCAGCATCEALQPVLAAAARLGRWCHADPVCLDVGIWWPGRFSAVPPPGPGQPAESCCLAAEAGHPGRPAWSARPHQGRPSSTAVAGDGRGPTVPMR